ncbi:HypC/HybG/HupF family hydrogenase formation chaperone [Acetobacter papayae]
MCLGIPARITGIADAAAMLADVDVHGVRRQVDVLCVAPPDAPLEELVAHGTGACRLCHEPNFRTRSPRHTRPAGRNGRIAGGTHRHAGLWHGRRPPCGSVTNFVIPR